MKVIQKGMNDPGGGPGGCTCNTKGATCYGNGTACNCNNKNTCYGKGIGCVVRW